VKSSPCVVRLLAEGGVIEVFGHKEPDGSWRFSARALSPELADERSDRVAVSGVRVFTDLADFLPPHWVRYLPTRIHPELRGWFRERYAATVASMPEWFQESHATYRHPKWQALFESTPPDRWSRDDDSSTQDFAGL
jgi:hypothetical protein